MFYLKSLKNIRNINGKGLLYVTANHGNLEVTKFLIKVERDIYLKDKKNGFAPVSRGLRKLTSFGKIFI